MAVEVTTYNIGQGLFNLVCEENGGKRRCGIVDCGTINITKNMFTDETLDNAIATIKKFRGNVIDYVVLSHQDKDHWSRILDLLERFYNIEQGTYYKNSSGTKAFFYTKNNKKTEVMKWDCKYQTFSYKFLEDYYQTQFMETWTSNTNLRIDFSLSIDTILDKFRCSIEAEYDSEIYAISACDPKKDKKINLDNPKEELEMIVPKLVKYIKDEYHIVTSETAITQYISNCFSKKKLGIDMYRTIANMTETCDANIAIYAGGEEAGMSYIMLKSILDVYGILNEGSRYIVLFTKDTPYPTGYSIFINVSEIYKDNDNDKDRVKPILRNATSFMTLFTQGNLQILFPGDATFHTFRRVLDRKIIKKLNFIVAPHHGSYHSNIVIDADNKVIKDQPVINFFKETTPTKVFISAFHGTFGHPRRSVVNFMEKYAAFTSKKEKHKLALCDDMDKNKILKTEETNKEIYTTEISNDLIYTAHDIIIKKPSVLSEKMIVPEDTVFLS